MSKPDNSHFIAIICYITVIGWIVALLMNQSNRSFFASFHIRQSLGIYLFSFLAVVPLLSQVVGIIVLVLWIIGFVNAIQKQMKPVPVVGEYFQDWFKNIG